MILARARCGLRSEAVALADALVKQSPADPRILYHAAAGYALCLESVRGEQGKQLEDKALDALERAVKHGWKDVVALERDPDLAALRNRSRVTALIGRLKNK